MCVGFELWKIEPGGKIYTRCVRRRSRGGDRSLKLSSITMNYHLLMEHLMRKKESMRSLTTTSPNLRRSNLQRVLMLKMQEPAVFDGK